MPNVVMGAIAASVPFDQTTSPIGNGDVQSAIDFLYSGGGLGPTNLSVSTNLSTNTTNTVYTAINGMSLTPALSGNYFAIFTAAMIGSSGSDTYVSVFVNAVQNVNSERFQTAGAGSHSLSMTTTATVSVTAGQTVTIQWKVSANTTTASGRSFALIKVQ